MVRLLVRIHYQSVCPAQSEDVLAALPSGVTCDNMNGNHTALLNPLTNHGRCGSVSHKV